MANTTVEGRLGQLMWFLCRCHLVTNSTQPSKLVSESLVPIVTGGVEFIRLYLCYCSECTMGVLNSDLEPSSYITGMKTIFLSKNTFIYVCVCARLLSCCYKHRKDEMFSHWVVRFLIRCLFSHWIVFSHCHIVDSFDLVNAQRNNKRLAQIC